MSNHLTPHFLHDLPVHTSHAAATAQANYAYHQARAAGAQEHAAQERESASQHVAQSKADAKKAVHDARVAAKNDPRPAKAKAKRETAEQHARATQNTHGANLSAQRAAKVKAAEALQKHGEGSPEHDKALKRLEAKSHAVRKSSVEGPIAAAKLRTARAKERQAHEAGAQNVENIRTAQDTRHAATVTRAKAKAKAGEAVAKSAKAEQAEAKGAHAALLHAHRQVLTAQRAHARHDKEQRARLSRVAGHVSKALHKAAGGSAAAVTAGAKLSPGIHNAARLR